MPRWERWTPLAGVVAVVGMVIGFGLITSSPSTNDSDDKITAYYASHSHQVKTLVSFFVFLAGLLILLVFFSALRARLVQAEGGLGRLGALAYGAGVASVVLWVGSIALVALACRGGDVGAAWRSPTPTRSRSTSFSSRPVTTGCRSRRSAIR